MLLRHIKLQNKKLSNNKTSKLLIVTNSSRRGHLITGGYLVVKLKRLSIKFRGRINNFYNYRPELVLFLRCEVSVIKKLKHIYVGSEMGVLFFF